MGDKRNYSLIGLDNECVFSKESISMSFPGITSIITAFESNKNPSDLFIVKENDLNNFMCIQLKNLLENLEKIKFWYDRTLIPSLQVMNKEEVRQCVQTLNLVDSKICQLSSITKKLKKQYNKKRGSSIQKDFEALCPVCNKFHYLKKSSDWLDIEDHDHIAEILSSGNVFNVTTFASDAESNECDQINTVRCENKTNKMEVNSDTTINQFQHETPLCLYDMKVRNTLYPLQLTSNISCLENNYKFYTIQAINSTRFQCLMCKVDMHQDKSVYSHVSGNRHKNKFYDRAFCSRMINYHQIFSTMPPEIQIHQIVFRPSYKPEFLYCKVCAIQINTDKIVQHISTEMHKVRLCTKRFVKYNFYEEMLKSFGIDACNSEEDSSEMSIKSQLIYNSEHRMKPFTSGAESVSLIEDKTDSKKGHDSTDEDSEEESSEISLKSQNVAGEKLLVQSDVPIQGTSYTILVDLNKKLALEKVKITNGKSSKQEDKNSDEKIEKIKHNVVPAFKANPISNFDLIEHRYQIHLDFLHYVNDIPQCTICMKNIPKPVKDIKNHFASNEHKKNAEMHCGKQKYIYYCDLCYKYIRNENKWCEHLSCTEHRQRVLAINKNKEPRGGQFKEYECTTCFLVIYGNNTTISKHIKENFASGKKIKKVKEVKLIPKLVNLLQNEQQFLEDINKLSRESTEVLKSIELSWQCCRAIENVLEPVFGECKAYPFGSRVSGLGNLVSDLDVFVDTGVMYEGIFNQDADSQARLVNQANRALKKHKDFADVFPIPNARTPIVQVYHKITGLDCDLSFRHGLSVENTEFLRLCIDVQPKLKLLILFLKQWSFFCKLRERISTYALSMLCIFYFQQKCLLPSVNDLRKIDPTKSKVIAGWETFCYTKPLTELNVIYPPCNIYIRNVLIEFFEFYMKFNFNKDVVCPLLGQTVLKSDFYEEKGKRLPSEMIIYVNKINESEENEVFRSMSPMCVQDPFDLSHNLTKACPVDFVTKFIKLCQLSHAELCKKG